MSLKVLITGGAGFLGSHLAERLLEEGHAVSCLDNFDPFYRPELKRHNATQLGRFEAFRLIEADLCRDGLADSVGSHSFDWVIHLAAQPNVRYSFENPERVFEVNVKGTQNLLEWLDGKPLKKFVFASSSSVYGDTNQVPFREGDSPDPSSPYGTSKVLAESLCREFARSTEVDLAVLRYFSLYGPRMRPDLAISRFFSNALRGEPLFIFGDGQQTRDFTFVGDAVEATTQVLLNGTAGTFNVGSGKPESIVEVANRILEITGSESPLVFTDLKYRENRQTHADTAKIRKRVSWSPQVGLDEGLEACHAWFRE